MGSPVIAPSARQRRARRASGPTSSGRGMIGAQGAVEVQEQGARVAG